MTDSLIAIETIMILNSLPVGEHAVGIPQQLEDFPCMNCKYANIIKYHEYTHLSCTLYPEFSDSWGMDDAITIIGCEEFEPKEKRQ